MAHRRALVRLFRYVVIAAASLVILYLVAANVFLTRAVFDAIVDANPDIVDIHFERAWSIFPARVHAKNLSIRGRDSHVEWRITLDEVVFDVRASAFFKRRFEAHDVHGKGISFRLRQRPDAPPADVTNIVPIEGLPPYSVRPPPTPAPDRWNDAAYHLWGVRLDRVVAEDVREVWIDRTRFEGNARVEGGFDFQPVRFVVVGPLHVVAERGRVTTHKGIVTEAFDGSVVDLTIARFDPRTATGADILGGLSTDADAHAALPDVARVSLPLDGALNVSRAAIHIKAGRLEPDSHLVASAPSATFTTDAHRVSGALDVTADVMDRFAFRAVGSGLEVSRKNETILRAPKVIATGDGSALELVRVLEYLHVVVLLPEGDILTLRGLSRYIPKKTPLSIEEGRAKTEARVEAWVAEKRATGHVAVRADHLAFHLAKLRVSGRTDVRAEIGTYRFGSHRLEDASLAIAVSTGALASSRSPDTPLVTVNGARLDATAPLVDLDDPLRQLAVAIALPSADVVSKGLLREYLPKGSEMQIASSRSRFSLRSNLAIADHVARGSLDIQSRELAIAYRDFQLDAQLHARARVHDWRWQTGDLVLDEARVDVNDVTLAKADAPGLSIARIGLAASSPYFQFSDPLAKIDLAAFFVDAKVRDFATINSFLPDQATFRFEGTEATFGARLDVAIADHTANGTLRAHAKRFGAAGKTAHLEGDVDLFVDFADWSFSRNTLAVRDSRVEISRVASRLHPEGASDFTMDRLFVAMRSPRFDLQRPSLEGADFRLIVKNGALPDARALAPLLPKDSVFGIEAGAAHVDSDVIVSSSRRAALGTVDLGLTHARIRLKTLRVSGDFRFIGQLSGFDPDRRRFDFSGTHVEIRNVAVTGATAKTTNWSGNVALSRTSLALASPITLDTVVHLEARDARPFLAILFQNDLPKIAVDLTDMPHLTASTRMVATARELALLDLDARGGNLSLRGSYAVREGHRRGGVIVKKWFLSAGVRIEDDGASLRLFGLDGWLRDRNRDVNALLEPRSR
jgi:hypothetical protein